MRKVELKMNEQEKYETIKRLVETNGNKQRAAVHLNLSIRQINRLINVYKTQGKAGFIHGNRGRKPISTKPDSLKDLIIELYKTKYFDANFVHFTELLNKYENINVSETFVYNLLNSYQILSPMCTKKIIKRNRELIKTKIKNNLKLTDQETDLVVSRNILNPEDNHARIPRSKYFGERVEVDASLDFWFGDRKTTLHGAIDCASGAILALFFDEQETLQGYYGMLDQILRNYGAPYELITDNRTVFNYTSSKNKELEKDTSTQFGYACKQLGISISTTSVPQKKPRIERLWGSLQNRLPVELRIAHINSIEDANEFLKEYIPLYNSKFALPIDYTTSVIENVDINSIYNVLSVYSKRIFKSSTIKYKNKYYQAFSNNELVNFKDKVECLVIETYDNRLICNVDEIIYELIELPERNEISPEFDPIPKERKKSTWVPPMDHPWKRASFLLYLAKQKHHKNDAYVY